MLRRHVVERGANGFVIKPTPEYQAKQAREQCMRERRANPKTNPSNRDIYELLLDLAERQSEIYDMMKEIQERDAR